MEPHIDLTELDNSDYDLNFFALRILNRVISLEEKRSGRMSGLRVFCRLDVSIFMEKDGMTHRYFVNEITRAHTAALFPQWDSNQRLDLFFSHMARTLHYISKSKLYLQPPKPFSKPIKST
jgi:hypothetical protein